MNKNRDTIENRDTCLPIYRLMKKIDIAQAQGVYTFGYYPITKITEL